MGKLIYSIEDDINISKIINKSLANQSYEVMSFYDAKSFWESFKQRKPDMVLLDLMLPDQDGLSILKKIREDKNNKEIEIIIVSAKNMVIDKVEGLDLGADDYIEKPFDILELISRVNARFRKHIDSDIIIYKDISINIPSHIVTKNNAEISLTNKEFDIVVYLFKNINKVVSRDELLNHIWGMDNSCIESRTIDMHIKSIREKLDDKAHPFIETIYGIGYKVNL